MFEAQGAARRSDVHTEGALGNYRYPTGPVRPCSASTLPFRVKLGCLCKTDQAARCVCLFRAVVSFYYHFSCGLTFFWTPFVLYHQVRIDQNFCTRCQYKEVYAQEWNGTSHFQGCTCTMTF